MRVRFDSDEERHVTFLAGATLIEYCDDELTESLFWRAVQRARAIHKVGDDGSDAGRG